MKLQTTSISFLILINCFILSEEIPPEVKRGIEALENPEIPYSDFLEAQAFYKKNYDSEIKNEHLSPYIRPRSFYTSGVYESKRIIYYSHFAGFGYCYPETIDEGKCCSKIFNKIKETTSPNGWSLIDYGRSSLIDTYGIYTHKKNTYAIFRSDLFKKVVITFPGTKDPVFQIASEVLNSNLVKPELHLLKNSDIKIGKYYLARTSALIDVIFSKKNIELMHLKEGYQVIFTGHSLGGAMATTTFLFGIDRGYITRELNKPVIITYGQPRAGNEDFALAVSNYAEVIYRNVNYMDIVTQIPLFSQGYRHTVGEIFITGDKNNYSIDRKTDLYDVSKIVDSQKYDITLLIKYLMNNMDRHTHYYAKHTNLLCDIIT